MVNASPSVDTAGILRDGKYFVLDDYALRDEMLAKARRAFFDGIEALAGADTRRQVEAAGLARLHEYFPVTKILLLEDFLLKVLQRDLFYWSFRVGRDDLGLKGRFYVDHLIVMRIHYPFLVARAAKDVERPPYPMWEKLRLGVAALKNWRLIANGLSKLRERKRQKSAYRPDVYHRKLPEPARAHGAHIDTWYGHSYDGINLWWSIDGVNEDNTVILYPDSFGFRLPYDPVSMYLAEGVPLTRPHKVVTRPGQLLVFNPEMLHGTQVNISNETRVVITTRLNPGQPRFDVNAAWNFEHWYASDDLERRRFTSVTVFPAKRYRGAPSFTVKTGTPAPATRVVERPGRLGGDQALQICASSELGEGEKVAVNFDNAKLAVFRAGGALRAFGRICPHLGIDMVGAFHDGTQVFCPGHGIAFSLTDGSSHCEAFKLRQYDAFERDGFVYLRTAQSERPSLEGTDQDPAAAS